MRIRLAFFFLILVILLAGCSLLESSPQATPTPTTFWNVLLQRTPYPYTTPLPPDEATLIDGIYLKVDPRQGTPFPCRRCPDYAPEGGIWRLSLEKGVYRIYHEYTGWRSIGSFTLDGNRLVLFNDPVCTNETGNYTWELNAGQLTLELVEDSCAIGLRALNLTKQDWLVDTP